ncbi:MAG: branched-chain amino acid ABC transporter permease, partial [Micrococcales bacterium]
MSRPKTLLGRGVALLMATGAMAIIALTSTTPANAAVETASVSTHSQSISASVLSASNDPSTWEYSIAGALKLNGKPIKGVTIVATLGSFSNKATTDVTGRWMIPVPTAGKYTVAVDQSTVPSGFKVANPTMVADLTQVSFAAVLFKFDGQAVATENVGAQLVGRLFAGLNVGLLLALGAIGISLIFGTTGLTNFAHGEMVTMGALSMWLFHAVLGLPVIVAALIAVALTGAFGWAQDAWLWKPLRRRRMGLVQMMIVSIGLSIVVRYTYQLFFTSSTK